MKKLLVALFAFFAFSGLALAAVDLNTGTVEQLDGLKGVGPAKAKAIVEYRTKNGPFKSVDDLEKVKGFGKKTVDALRSDVSVGSEPAKAEAKADKGKMDKAEAKKEDKKEDKKDAKKK
ncbi:MAG: helix-hairpin-helix domain-containing protein [Sulfuricella sp.]|nr:helix-hairpin-helix domain-containing protein [Sulfuricella sp.]